MLSITLYIIYLGVLIAVSITDIRTRKILNKIIVPAMGLAVIAMFYQPGWISAMQGALLAGAFMLVPVVALGKGGGMGDFKMAIFMGLILGFPNVVWALVIAHVGGALLLIGVPFGWISLKSKVPFAPFLAAGAIFILTVATF